MPGRAPPLIASGSVSAVRHRLVIRRINSLSAPPPPVPDPVTRRVGVGTTCARVRWTAILGSVRIGLAGAPTRAVPGAVKELSGHSPSVPDSGHILTREVAMSHTGSAGPGQRRRSGPRRRRGSRPPNRHGPLLRGGLGLLARLPGRVIVAVAVPAGAPVRAVIRRDWPAWTRSPPAGPRQRPGPRRGRRDLRRDRRGHTAPFPPDLHRRRGAGAARRLPGGDPVLARHGPTRPTRPRTASGCSRSRPGSVARAGPGGRTRRLGEPVPADRRVPGPARCARWGCADRRAGAGAGRVRRDAVGRTLCMTVTGRPSSRSGWAPGPATRPTTPATTRSCWPTATGATSSTATATGGARRSSPTWTGAGTTSTWRSRTGSTTSTSAPWSATPTPSSPPRCTSSDAAGGTGAAPW